MSRGYRIGLSQEQIASIIGKNKSTVSRELARSFSAPGSSSPKRDTARGNGCGYRRVYDAERAHRNAEIRGRRPKSCRLDRAPLREEVWELLRADWSPEQIAEMLPVLFPDDPDMRVSHETIYQSLFVQTKGELKRELTSHLRTRRSKRKAQTGGAKRVTLGITDDIRIQARPAEAEDRAVPGHWEGDLLLGEVGKGAVITLVERSSRFVLLAPLPGQHTADLARSPWQRGSNENTNGLLRQYWPKGADLRGLTQTECDAVALRLNTRPRKTLNWQTPGQVLNPELVAAAD